jgi:hypothetical protein
MPETTVTSCEFLTVQQACLGTPEVSADFFYLPTVGLNAIPNTWMD